MKNIILILYLILVTPIGSLADSLPHIPDKYAADFHYASDTNLSYEIRQAILSAENVLKSKGYLDHLNQTNEVATIKGTNIFMASSGGYIFNVEHNRDDYLVWCRQYVNTRNREMFFLPVGDILITLNNDFSFKSIWQGD